MSCLRRPSPSGRGRGTTVTIVGVLLLANLVLLLIVFGRRLRELRRAGRAERFERECEQMLEEVAAGRDLDRLAARIRRFDELERPIAATMLLERLGTASAAERAAVLDALRQAGAIDLLVRSLPTGVLPGDARSRLGRSGSSARPIPSPSWWSACPTAATTCARRRCAPSGGSGTSAGAGVAH